MNLGFFARLCDGFRNFLALRGNLLSEFPHPPQPELDHPFRSTPEVLSPPHPLHLSALFHSATGGLFHGSTVVLGRFRYWSVLRFGQQLLCLVYGYHDKETERYGFNV